MKNKNALLAFLTTSALVAATGSAQAVPNVAFVNVAVGNTFGTDLKLTADTTGSNVLYMAATGGTGNDAVVTQNAAVSSTSNTSQYGAKNKTVSTFAGGTTNSTINSFQGNSPEQAAINKFAVAIANNNVNLGTVGGDSQNLTTVQKGDENVAISALMGAGSNAIVIQEMRDKANANILDAQGNRYKGGNDSVVNSTGGKHSININQYNGNVSKVNAEGDQITASVKQVNTLFDANRKYNNVSVLNQKGTNIVANIDQSGAGELSTVNQTGTGLNATVTQQNGGGKATITQEGEAHIAAISQTADSTATITQSGKGHDTLISQIGGKNVTTATITGLNNKATLNSEGDTNTITLVQKTGQDNNASVTVKGVSHIVDVKQDGSTNLANINVSGANSSVVEAPQTGNGNKINVTQTVTSNTYSLTVSGLRSSTDDSFNSAESTGGVVYKGILFTTANPYLETWVGQKGDNNTANITHKGSDSRIYYQQIGNGNTLDVNLDVQSGLSRTNQIGNNNKIQVTQLGVSSLIGHPVGVVDLLQQGDGNSIKVLQDEKRYTYYGTRNLVYGKQIGNNNSYDITQLGSGRAMLTSLGDNNSITLLQGDWSGVTLNPNNDNSNWVGVTQNGSNNTANITQTGPRNVLNLTQQGSGLNFTVHQTGYQTLGLTQTHN